MNIILILFQMVMIRQIEWRLEAFSNLLITELLQWKLLLYGDLEGKIQETI